MQPEPDQSPPVDRNSRAVAPVFSAGEAALVAALAAVALVAVAFVAAGLAARLDGGDRIETFHPLPQDGAGYSTKIKSARKMRVEKVAARF